MSIIIKRLVITVITHPLDFTRLQSSPIFKINLKGNENKLPEHVVWYTICHINPPTSAKAEKK
jgi:hypothetical protein